MSHTWLRLQKAEAGGLWFQVQLNFTVRSALSKGKERTFYQQTQYWILFNKCNASTLKVKDMEWHVSQSVDKSTDCSCRGPRVNSQHTQRSSQPPTIPVPEESVCSFDPLRTRQAQGHIRTCKQNTITCKMKF